jgi:hypothetical protein
MIAEEEINKEIIENHKGKIMTQGLMGLVLKDQDRRDKIQTDLDHRDQDRRVKILMGLVLKEIIQTDLDHRGKIQTDLVLKVLEHRAKIQMDHALKEIIQMDLDSRVKIQTDLVPKEIIQMGLDPKETVTHKKKTSNYRGLFLFNSILH